MSENLDSMEWREFVLGEIFKINATIDGIDKNKLNGTQGIFPYITRTDKQNGIDDFIGKQELYRLNFKGCISVGLDTQTAFWQENEFYTGQNIQIIYNDKLNKYNALFFIVQIKNLMKIFNWGGTGATLTRLRRSKILLPIDSQGQPNYDFMEKFMRQIEQRQIKNQLKTIKSKLTQSTQCTFDTSTIKWKEFKISDLFEIFTGATIKQDELISGKIPRITATDSNNGTTAFTQELCQHNFKKFKNFISVSFLGSVFYQSNEVSLDMKIHGLKIKNKELNTHIALFLIPLIKQFSFKYTYGYQLSTSILKTQKIILPIDSNGNPHYAFMESTMRNLEQKHLRGVFEYFNAKDSGKANGKII